MVPSESLLEFVNPQVSALQLELNAATGGRLAVPGAGRRATTVASQEDGAWKNQVHCGSTVPALASTAYSASARRMVSETSVMGLKPAGGLLPTTPFDIAMAYARSPAAPLIAPGSTGAVVESNPVAEWNPSSAVAAATP